MGLILCIVGLLGARTFIRRSLGDGLGFLLLVGSLYGLARARFLDGFAHFWFDAAVLGAYWGGLSSVLRVQSGAARSLPGWVLALCGFPLLLVLLSPFIDSQPVLIQLVGLRPAALFVPLILFGAAMNLEQWFRFSRWAAWLAIFCAVIAVAELIFGVDSFFPLNDVTSILYASRDVGEGEFRIPSTFSSAHAYAGAMLGILPVLVFRTRVPSFSGLLTWSAVAAASFGVLIAGARTPVLILAVLAAVLLIGSARSPRQLVLLLMLGAGLAFVVPRFEQFKRIETLRDPELVTERFESSVNLSVLDAIANYPLGRGLGSAFGTNIPYFLANEARPQLGAENEYARIALEEGLLGLLLWLCFICFTLIRDPRRLQVLGGLPDRMMYVLCIATWGQGLIGVGMLSAVPGSLILFTQLGFLVASCDRHLARSRPLLALKPA
jgi:hypothetical protein